MDGASKVHRDRISEVLNDIQGQMELQREIV